ncbi:MAG: transketolase family protein [Clostridia bacterium]|nr:transketolase family protein [Clostridia bacterium]
MKDLGKQATREAYGLALKELGETHDFFVLDADLSKSTKTNTFEKAFPDRFVNCGIAEGNMMGVAAGMAAAGHTVFASTFAMFAAGRAYDAVRNAIGYPHLNVKIAATHAGLSVGEDGATHQCIEDLALMRAIPGMVVCCPSDGVTTRAAVAAALAHEGPVYLRLGRLSVPTLYEEGTPFSFGKAIVLKEGSDLTIVACGLMTARALLAAEALEAEGISAAVLDCHTVKPLDAETITAYAKKTGAVVTAEEHSILGGLGGAVAELLSETCPVPLRRVGVRDVFGSSGKAEAVLTAYGLTAEDVAEAAREVLKGK